MATRPSFDCTEDKSPDWADGSWGRPSLSDHPEAEEGTDFDELSDSDQDAIRARFIEQSGDDYSDLGYPVKNPATDCLNRNGVLAARQRASAEDDSEVASIADDLWEDNFEDEEEAQADTEQSDSMDSDDELGLSDLIGLVADRIEGASTEDVQGALGDLTEDSYERSPAIKLSSTDSMARHCRDEGLAYYRDFAPWDGPNPKVTRSSTEDRVDVTINTRTPDRHGTIILPKGARLERYNEGNPIVLINHDHDLPAGVSTVSVRDGHDPVLQATMEDREWDLDDERIARWHSKVTNDPPIVRSSSIGALFHEVVPGRDFDRIDQMMDTSDVDPRDLPDVVTDWTLAEWSWVSVPSNPDATISRQLIDRMAREAQSQIDRVTSHAERALQQQSVPSDAERSSDEDDPSGDSPESEEKDGTPTRLSNEEVQFIAKKTAEDEIDRATGRK